jgi:membrane associated rhomboid family serine protease
MFAHGGFTHLFFNMFALWMFGCVVENVWGPKKFIFYYISCGVGAGMFQELAQFGQFYMEITSQQPTLGILDMPAVATQLGEALNTWTTVGASGAIYAILLAFGMIFPEERIFIFPLPIPIKAKWFVLLYAGIELFSAISTSGDGVAHLAHLGGMIFGFFMIRYWQKNPSKGYGPSKGEDFFSNLRSSWEKRTKKKADTGRNSTGNPDWDYNAQKKTEQDEIDRILDKIRRSGYDSLTAEEKRKLFDQSK